MKVKEQIHEKYYSLYCSDNMFVLPELEKESIDLSVYSPPFCGLYQYSSSENDHSNCDTPEQFLEAYEFVVKEMSRITKPGRINAVHCQDVLTHTTKHNLYDFPHEIIKLHLKHGFTFNNRIIIWKEPLEVRNRTMVNSLKHKQLCEDSTLVYPALPDQLLIFRKAGENKIPVTHELGLTHYAGAQPILDYSTTRERSMADKYGDWDNIVARNKGKVGFENKMSHIIFQRYMSSVWMDSRVQNVLPFKDAREEDDEKHVHPLQLDVIDRIVDLYSNPNEIVLTPYMGVGSEVYSPVSMGRKAIGIELKDSYFKQAILNLKEAQNRFLKVEQKTIFDETTN
jgi:DNA modification methylase